MVTQQPCRKSSPGAAWAVARLGEKCRETLRGYYWREESNERIAAKMDRVVRLHEGQLD